MANTSGNQFAVGVRRAVVFQLDADGFPLASGTSAYEGSEVVGPKAFSLSIAESRKISHVGNDRVLAIDYLPPTEGDSGELRVASSDIVLKSILNNTNAFQIGEATAMGWGTDQRGNEVDAGLLLFQQSLDAASRSRRWKFYIVPKARIIPSPSNMDENPAEDKYTIGPNPTTYHLWGATMTLGSEGFTESAIIEGMSEGRPNIVAFKGDNSTVEFIFPASKPATATGKVAVWLDGVRQNDPGDVTITTSKITFGTPPGTGTIVVVYYEY